MCLVSFANSTGEALSLLRLSIKQDGLANDHRKISTANNNIV